MNKNIVKLIKEEIDDIVNSQEAEVITFENNPIEFILQKYPSLDVTLVDLMSPVYRDYITGTFIMSPKPTIFKILLHNGQSFLLTYNPKSYIAKVSGKHYNLINLKEEEYAIKAISNLLLQGPPPGSAGPGEEIANDVDMKDSFVNDMTAEPGGDDFNLDGVDSSPEQEAPTDEPEEELQEQEVIQPKVTKFRIIR